MGDRTRRKRWRAGWRTRTGLWLCAVLWALPAWGCFSTHGPQDSTETGNPPVLDIRRVALKVNADTVHVVGDKGAVTPGRAAIEITNLTTGLVTKAKANADGSFDVQVGGSPDEAFVVRASTGSAKSSAVYVVRGSAVVGTGKNDALSCEQRDQLAGAQLQLAATGADKHCLIDSDCSVALEVASCHDRCQYAIVSQQGKDEIDAISATIDAGLCSSYAQDGCMNVLLPCVSPPAVKCVLGPSASSGGQCMQADAPAMLSCHDRDQMAGQEIFDAVQAADRSCEVDADCVTASAASVCHDSCGLAVGAVSQAGKAAIDAAVARVNNGLCGTFIADGCLGPQGCGPVRLPGFPRCTDGQCALSQTPPTSPNECTTCLTDTLEWGLDGGFVAYLDHSTLVPCAHYTHSRRPGGDPTATSLSCESDFTGCAAITSTGAVLSALNDADVQQALANSPVLYGDDERAADGSVFQIKLGTRVVTVGTPVGPQGCGGVSPSCIPIPPGVQALVDRLRAIDNAAIATPACSSFAM